MSNASTGILTEAFSSQVAKILSSRSFFGIRKVDKNSPRCKSSGRRKSPREVRFFSHAHKNTCMALKWNRHNGNWLISASRDHFCKLFDVRNLKEEVQCFRGHKKEACSKRSSSFRSMDRLLCIFPFTETINTSVLSVRCLVTHCHSFSILNKSLTCQKDRCVALQLSL